MGSNDEVVPLNQHLWYDEYSKGVYFGRYLLGSIYEVMHCFDKCFKFTKEINEDDFSLTITLENTIEKPLYLYKRKTESSSYVKMRFDDIIYNLPKWSRA